MQIVNKYINPGIIKYDEKRHQILNSYKKAIQRAEFFSKSAKDHLELFGMLLTNQQLQKARKLIVDEDLRHLKTKHQLEKIKPKKEK